MIRETVAISIPPLNRACGLPIGSRQLFLLGSTLGRQGSGVRYKSLRHLRPQTERCLEGSVGKSSDAHQNSYDHQAVGFSITSHFGSAYDAGTRLAASTTPIYGAVFVFFSNKTQSSSL